MIYKLVPHISIGVLYFLSNPNEVEKNLGKPDYKRKTSLGDIFESRNKKTLSCIFDGSNNGLIEVNFTSVTDEVIFRSKDIWKIKYQDILDLAKETDVYSGTGSIVIPEFGFGLTGFFPADKEIRAINTFAKGAWDEVILNMKKIK